MKSNKGITIAREIMLIITLCLSVADLVLMIVQYSLESKQSKHIYTIKDNDEIPF